MIPFRQFLILLLLCTAPALAADRALLPIGPAYASTAVNADIYRCASVLTAAGRQFACYYDPTGHIVVARRDLPDSHWDLATLPTTANIHDAHNDIVIGAGSDGILHLSYDQHDQPLHYRASARPYDIHSFLPESPMTGDRESRVTYPQFISGPGGELLFFYRDGVSGNGALCINRYDAAAHSWRPLSHPLIDGRNQCNPYWSRPSISADGAIHIAWCWRDTPDAQTNHDLCYTHSLDGGHTWLRSDNTPQAVPITPANAEVIFPVPKNSNLINQCSMATDSANFPHLAEYFNDADGIPQYFHIWFDGARWRKAQVSRRTTRFSISGGGSLAIPISRPEIAITRGDAVIFITRQAEFDNHIRLYSQSAPNESWKTRDLATADLGDWEPTYDVPRWSAKNILDLFLLPVRQGNHERTTGFAAQTAAIYELSP